MLSYPNKNDFFTLDTAASNTGMGAVPSQEQENTEKITKQIHYLAVFALLTILIVSTVSW